VGKTITDCKQAGKRGWLSSFNFEVSKTSASHHMQNVRKSAQYHNQALRHIRSSLTADMVKTVENTLVNSCIDSAYADHMVHLSKIW